MLEMKDVFLATDWAQIDRYGCTAVRMNVFL